jgi:hypothetical protein
VSRFYKHWPKLGLLKANSLEFSLARSITWDENSSYTNTQQFDVSLEKNHADKTQGVFVEKRWPVIREVRQLLAMCSFTRSYIHHKEDVFTIAFWEATNPIKFFPIMNTGRNSTIIYKTHKFS